MEGGNEWAGKRRQTQLRGKTLMKADTTDSVLRQKQ